MTACCCPRLAPDAVGGSQVIALRVEEAKLPSQLQHDDTAGREPRHLDICELLGTVRSKHDRLGGYAPGGYIVVETIVLDGPYPRRVADNE